MMRTDWLWIAAFVSALALLAAGAPSFSGIILGAMTVFEILASSPKGKSTNDGLS